MIDVEIYNNGAFDISFENGDIKHCYETDKENNVKPSLRTAILMSIFCEKRADDFLVENIENRRGHYSNQFNQVDDYEVGSFYWLFTEQEKIAENSRDDLQDTINEGLQWLVDDGYLSQIECNIDIANNKYVININYTNIFNQKGSITI